FVSDSNYKSARFIAGEFYATLVFAEVKLTALVRAMQKTIISGVVESKEEQEGVIDGIKGHGLFRSAAAVTQSEKVEEPSSTLNSSYGLT
ncbi:MAG TPA: hypothetical protein VD770_00255, partial [Coxiellaceae bacterium]|nr:hypothetical protein [Coxiellaceae bacterium]